MATAWGGDSRPRATNPPAPPPPPGPPQHLRRLTGDDGMEKTTVDAAEVDPNDRAQVRISLCPNFARFSLCSRAVWMRPLGLHHDVGEIAMPLTALLLLFKCRLGLREEVIEIHSERNIAALGCCCCCYMLLMCARC